MVFIIGFILFIVLVIISDGRKRQKIRGVPPQCVGCWSIKSSRDYYSRQTTKVYRIAYSCSESTCSNWKHNAYYNRSNSAYNRLKNEFKELGLEFSDNLSSTDIQEIKWLYKELQNVGLKYNVSLKYKENYQMLTSHLNKKLSKYNTNYDNEQNYSYNLKKLELSKQLMNCNASYQNDKTLKENEFMLKEITKKMESKDEENKLRDEILKLGYNYNDSLSVNENYIIKNNIVRFASELNNKNKVIKALLRTTKVQFEIKTIQDLILQNVSIESYIKSMNPVMSCVYKEHFYGITFKNKFYLTYQDGKIQETVYLKQIRQSNGKMRLEGDYIVILKPYNGEEYGKLKYIEAPSYHF